MRPIFVSFFAFMILPCCDEALGQKPAGNKQEEKNERRCVYLGRSGSFHIIGSGGSAAYVLGNRKYISDLRENGEDANFWYFTTSNGDPATNGWAFARKANCDGTYWVWRSDRGGWHAYEATRAWGNGLGGSFAQMASGPSLGERVERLETRVEW